MQDPPARPPLDHAPITGSSPGNGPLPTPPKTRQVPPKHSDSGWCIILREGGDDIASDDSLTHLRRVLDDRAITHRIAPNPYFAMAELVLREKLRRSDNTANHPLILLITPTNRAKSPDSRQKALAAAAKRVIPALACWWFERDSHPALVDFEKACEKAAERPEIVFRPGAARAFHRHTATLRLTGDGNLAEMEEIGDGAQPPAETELPDDSILTAEELRLLLSDDEDEQTGHHGRS